MIDGAMNVEGGKQLAAALKDLPGKIAANALQNALMQGADVIRDDARSKFPGKSGRTGIITKKARIRRRDERRAQVAASRNRWYLKFIEFGRAAFKMGVKRKRALASDGEVFGREVNIPAMPARPFMRPALQSKAGAAIKKMADVLRRNIEQAARDACQVAANREAALAGEPFIYQTGLRADPAQIAAIVRIDGLPAGSAYPFGEAQIIP